MKYKIIAIVCAVVVIGGGIVWALRARDSNTNKAPSKVAESHSAETSGFPNGQQLASLTNFVSELKSSDINSVEHVHSRVNYKQVVNDYMTRILYKGKTYSKIGEISGSKNIKKTYPEEDITYFSYTKSLASLLTSPSVSARKVGDCNVAKRSGNKWIVSASQADSNSTGTEYQACVAKTGGALLSLVEGTELESATPKLKAVFLIRSIGGVPEYTPADL